MTPCRGVVLVWAVALLVTGCAGSSVSATTTSQAATAAESWIVYQRWTEGTGGRIHLVRTDGTGDHELLPEMVEEQFHPDWSPDGQTLAFVADDRIWTARADGTGARMVYECPPPCAYADFPAWSHDGSLIAVATAIEVDGTWPYSEVLTVDPDTGEATSVFRIDGPDYVTYPRWAPDGRSLVVAFDRYPGIEVDDPDNAFVSGGAIGVLDLVTETHRLLTGWELFATYPDWSPEGGSIVFSTYDLGLRDADAIEDTRPPSDLYTVDPDGTDLVRITHNQAGERLIRRDTASGPLSGQPTWAPDGERIIFVQVEGETWPGWGMATIAADGSDLAPAAGSAFRYGTHPRVAPTG